MAEAFVLGERVVRRRTLGGGCLFDVAAVDLASGRRVVVKSGAGGLRGQLPLEARMLGDLARVGVTVPAVLAVDGEALVLEWIEHDAAPLDRAGRRRVAGDLARLHDQPQPAFGYAYDTVIGALPQPNPRQASWIAFFREQRLLGPAAAARREGVLPAGIHGRLEGLAARLDELLDEPLHPSLLHGDLWAGNVLGRAGRPVAWIDPAVYCGHPEIELAFGRLFGPLDADAIAAYAERRRLQPGFEPTRCAIYQLYPLLVHARLFGASYVGAVQKRLEILGL